MARAAPIWIFYLLLTVSVSFVFAPNVSAKTLKVGVLAHRGDEPARQRWHPTFEFLSHRISGYRLIVEPLSLQGMSAALDGGGLDLVLTNPGNFHQLTETYKLEPVVSLRTDRSGEPRTGNRLGAVIFVRSDNTAVRGLADIRNKRLGAVSPDAFGGFRIAADTLLRNGINPWRDLEGIEYFGFPQDKIVSAVVNGEIDAGTVRTGVIESMMLQGKLSPSDIRVVNSVRVPGFELALSTQLFPEWVLGASPDVPETLKREIAINLLSLKDEHPAARSGSYAGWSTIAHTGSIMALMKNTELASAGFIPSRSTARLVAIVLAISALLSIAALVWFRRSKKLSRAETATGILWHDGAPVSNVSLTRREQDILGFVEQGLTSKQIARELSISHKTVEYHRSHLLRKFDAQNMTQVVGKTRHASTNDTQS